MSKKNINELNAYKHITNKKYASLIDDVVDLYKNKKITNIATARNLVRNLSSTGPKTAVDKIKSLTNKSNASEVLNITGYNPATPQLNRNERINNSLNRIATQTVNRTTNDILTKRKYDKIALNGVFKEIYLIDPDFTTTSGPNNQLIKSNILREVMKVILINDDHNILINCIIN